MTAPSRLLSLIVCGVLLAGCGKSRTDAPTAARPDPALVEPGEELQSAPAEITSCP